MKRKQKVIENAGLYLNIFNLVLVDFPITKFDKFLGIEIKNS